MHSSKDQFEILPEREQGIYYTNQIDEGTYVKHLDPAGSLNNTTSYRVILCVGCISLGFIKLISLLMQGDRKTAFPDTSDERYSL